MEELGSLNIPTRNLGKKQMPTDNAVYVAKQIAGGKRLRDIPFQDELIIPIRKGEEVILPFRYALADGKPLTSKKLLSHIRTRRGF